MATAYSGYASASYSFGTCYTRCYNEASVSNVSDERSSVTVSGAVQSGMNGSGRLYLQGVECQVGHAEAGGVAASWESTTARMNYESWVAGITRSYEFPRGHSAYNVSVWTKYWGSSLGGAASAVKQSGEVFQTVTIPAKTSYPVSYDANGGSGAPTSQTKWHGENLALSSGKPTRSLYNFKGWSTSENGNVQYAPGETYTGNAALTLYAVWEIAYKPPTITGVSAYRCDASGTSADEGTYAYVSFKWAVDTSATPGNAASQVRIGIREKGSSGSYAYGTVQGVATGTSGTAYAVLGGSLSADAQYEVVVSIKDATSYANSTVTATGVITKAFFTMDFYRGGHGIAFGAAATAEGFECAMPATFTGGFKIGSTSLTEEQLARLIALIK